LRNRTPYYSTYFVLSINPPSLLTTILFYRVLSVGIVNELKHQCLVSAIHNADFHLKILTTDLVYSTINNEIFKSKLFAEIVN